MSDKKEKVSVTIRLDSDTISRIDEVAQVMGMKRATYCQYVLENWHSENFNPLKTAQTMLENAAKYRE